MVMLRVTFFYAKITILHGFAIIATKKLISTHMIHINFFLGSLVLFSSAILMPSAMANADYHKPTSEEMLYAFFLTGIPMVLGQYMEVSAFLMTKKLRMVTLFQFSNIILGYVVSIVRYGEDVNILCLIGGVAIFLGVVFNIKLDDEPQK